MPRYAKKTDIPYLFNKIVNELNSVNGYLEELDPLYESFPKLMNDLEKINFDFENFSLIELPDILGSTSCNDFLKNNFTDGDVDVTRLSVVTIDELKDKLNNSRIMYGNYLIQLKDYAVLLGQAGGDWEIPVYYVIYEDDKGELRGYIPEHGNTFNPETRAAYSGEDEDCPAPSDIKPDFDLMFEDIQKRIIVREN